MRNKHENGFTLIELSIVLVIIGLIAGGILLGKDLITAASLRGTIKQLDQYKTAVNTFRIKYNCIPGDCANAVSFGLGTSGGPGDNGNGDGLIDSRYGNGELGSWSYNKEMVNFWYHLRQANMLDAPVSGWINATPSAANTTYAPPLKAPNASVIWAFSAVNTGLNVFATAAIMQTGNSFSYPASFSVTQAYALDSKMDDGLPGSGLVRATWIAADYAQVSNYVPGQTASGMNNCYHAVGCTMAFCTSLQEPNQYDLGGKWKWPNPVNDGDVDSIECGLAFSGAF